MAHKFVPHVDRYFPFAKTASNGVCDGCGNRATLSPGGFCPTCQSDLYESGRKASLRTAMDEGDYEPDPDDWYDEWRVRGAEDKADAEEAQYWQDWVTDQAIDQRREGVRKIAGAWDGYWANVESQIKQMRSARSAADVIRILGPESASSGDAFFDGDGDEMEDALMDAGWRTYRYEAPYYWVMKAPDGSFISYTEGDVSKGDNEGVGPVEGSRRTAMPNPVDLGVSVGDIFVDSWGYDQTNIDFYEVTGLTGASVRVRRIDSRIVSGVGSPQEQVEPVPGSYFGDEMTRLISGDGSYKPAFKTGYNSYAFLWQGEPRWQTGWGYGH